MMEKTPQHTAQISNLSNSQTLAANDSILWLLAASDIGFQTEKLSGFIAFTFLQMVSINVI